MRLTSVSRDSTYSIPERVNSGDEAYIAQVSARGFLIATPHTPDSDAIINSPFHLCARIGGKVAGIIRADNIDPTQEDAPGERTKWHREGEERLAYESGQNLEIGVVMVDKQYQGQRIAQELLNKLCEFLKQTQRRYLFSWVAMTPPNKPSLRFHERMGFQHIATYYAPEAYGVKSYQARGFVKRI